MVAVEIPSKSRRTSSRRKKPLKQISVVGNFSTPNTSPVKFSSKTPEPLQLQDDDDETENVVPAKFPPIASPQLPRQPVWQKVGAVPAKSPPRQLNVASILAKSPNRPMCRVGLSRRVNVEPLHGYLKKKVS